MGKPAARIGDEHECPLVTPGTGTPHIGGPIFGPGCVAVLIEGKPAATAGDVCVCAGAMDKITGGSSGVFIGGKPAARAGDRCEHGGFVIGGSATVLIGESMGKSFLMLPCVWENDGEHKEPSKEEKMAIVNKAISDCIALIENRLELLLREDAETILRFEKWFGCFTQERKAVIVDRMEKQLEFFRNMKLDTFERIPYEIDYRNLFAQVYAADNFRTIYLGNPFWNDKLLKTYSRAIVLIHEASHFEDLGGTIDYEYDDECENLAKDRPHKALYNADSYAFFIARHN